MATNVYCRKTLNDNWFEDRAQPEGALSATAGAGRTARKVETDLAYIGERYDVLARISRFPARASYATPDDGFRETLSTNLADLRDPKAYGAYSSKAMPVPPMINEANAPVCPPEQRPLEGPASGFGAPLPRHAAAHESRSWTTTHGDVYGYGDSMLARSVKTCPSALRASGLSSEDAQNRVAGMKCGQLCGEGFNESPDDPGRDTRSQRAWLPGGDVALANIHLGGTQPALARVDNELSLSLGDGAMAKIRADLKERKGRLCRTATNITKGAHHKSGMSVFQDDD